MKDQEFLQRAADNRAALILDMESRRKASQIGSWVCFAILLTQIVLAMVRDTRFVHFGPVLTASVTAMLVTSQMYYDALLKALKLRSET